jgi:DNA-binding GntR family transcriptional regulator
LEWANCVQSSAGCQGAEIAALHTVPFRATFSPVSISPRPDAAGSPKRATATYGELPDRIYATLRDQIIRGRLAPDLRLVEVELASRFAVSRTPVREALARLVREGYVVALGPGRRTSFQVAPLTTAALQELWAVIGALEGVAIQAIGSMSAAQRSALVVELERLNTELERAVEARPRDMDLVGELMSAFHVAFMDRCAGPWLRNLYDGVRPHVQRYEWAYATYSDAAYTPSIREHRQIIAAIAAADPPAAKEMLERHWVNGGKRAVATMKRLADALSARAAP